MKKLIILFVLVLFFGSVSALCDETQIDINNAPKEELDNLYGIGPVKADAIINSRPFSSVNDLINVWGIGEATLNKIKEQGLACVNEETKEIEEEEENNETPENTEDIDTPDNQDNPIEELKDVQKTPTKLDTIKLSTLSTKTIKSEDNKEDLNKNNYAVYGFVVFCVLLGFLFILKKRKNYKTEFEGDEE